MYVFVFLRFQQHCSIHTITFSETGGTAMSRPTRDAIETYMTLTGASESLAFQKLEEHGGNLNEAVDAHFNAGIIDMNDSGTLQGNTYMTNPSPAAFPQQNYTDRNNETQFGGGLLPLLSAARSFRPSLLLDPNYRRDLFNRIGAGGFTGRQPLVTQPAPVPVTGIPAEFNNSRHHQIHHSGLSPNIGNDHMPTEYNTSQVDNHVEDEMVEAAIRASKQEFEDSSGDDDIARALSLSLKTAEQEQAARGWQMKDYNEELGTHRGWKPGSSSSQNIAMNAEDEQLIRRISNSSAGNLRQHNDDAFQFGEWGGISSKEIDEALMLESTLYGGISEGASKQSLNAPQVQSHPERNVIPILPVHSPISPSLSASRLLKEQQDMEYHASLLLDKEREEESRKKIHSEMEYEKNLATKKASLPSEPALEDENAVTLLVRMPNGSRLGRRFLKSNKLQLLFDFIDFDGVVKPGTYRVVRSYPRRAFNVDDSSLTLSELGLTNKQEALFLELI
ncbi:plant UBX domain-containing protein 8 isoform X2 [Humulus lupulus]|uniref:plant UBX domain-containing protein 8 isoform X2 n=1 Tax=Humulus lupulus TaxID=3486 RepID=UPI002B41009A|nr:plant UBX domain-containing protein 8 isoform X2 [Humulus lupulus]